VRANKRPAHTAVHRWPITSNPTIRWGMWRLHNARPHSSHERKPKNPPPPPPSRSTLAHLKKMVDEPRVDILTTQPRVTVRRAHLQRPEQVHSTRNRHCSHRPSYLTCTAIHPRWPRRKESPLSPAQLHKRACRSTGSLATVRTVLIARRGILAGGEATWVSFRCCICTMHSCELSFPARSPHGRFTRLHSRTLRPKRRQSGAGDAP
jgi:hypothetical protein